MSKKILVTGGAGFLGSHLCRELLAQNQQVICLDNLTTGSKKNIEILASNHNFQFILHDICNPVKIEADEIYNLACPASPIHYQKDPIQTFKTCIYGSINMLDEATRLRAKILQASTSEVYGDPEVHPQVESYKGSVNPIGIRACYDEGKRGAETLFFDYHRQKGIKIKVVRIFNTYGPLMHPEDGRVVSNFIMQALKNEDITIYGDGSQTRSFCYVSDLVTGLIKMMNSRDYFLGPVNLGNPEEFKIIDFAQKIIKLTNSSSKIVQRPLPADDPTQRRPNINLAKKELDWSPKVKIEEGLTKTIEYFQQLLHEQE